MAFENTLAELQRNIMPSYILPLLSKGNGLCDFLICINSIVLDDEIGRYVWNSNFLF
jgi:hypothetical protein